MTLPALKQTTTFRPALTLVKGGLSCGNGVLTVQPAPSRQMVILAAMMIVLQIADGILTGLGVSHFGTEAEGNPLLRLGMEYFGHIPTLIITKLIAVGVVLALLNLSRRVGWIQRALKVVIAVYLLAAVLPWSGILLFHAS